MDLFNLVTGVAQKNSANGPSPLLPSAAPPPVLPSSSPQGQMPPPNVSIASVRFTETSPHEKGFSAYFDEKLKPVIRELEQERLMAEEEVKRIKPKAVAVHIIGTLVALGLTIWTQQAGWLIFGAIVAYGIKVAMLSGPKSKVMGKYKEKIVPHIVKFFGNFNYSPATTPPEAVLRASGLFDGFNRIEGSDYIEGNHKGTNFKFSEVELVQSGGKHSHTVFNGMIILMDVKTPFAGQTVVKRDSQKGLWASMTGKFKGMQNVPMENSEFEKIFETYSSDPNEVKMLVTPDFMARMMRLNEMHKDSMVRCCFFGGQLLLALGYGGGKIGGGFFETGFMQKSLLDMEDIHKFLAEMNAILQIIETVNPPKKEM
jgi:hypothetical protein